MIPIDASETDYERFEILGQDALFISLRIARNSLPEGLHAYDLRDEDSTGEICELKSYVMVNHWGTVIVKEPIEGADDGIDLDENDYNYLGEEMSLEEFVNPAPTMEQSM